MQTQDPATMLRLMTQALLAKGLITPILAEQAMLNVAALEQQAKLGQQLGALGIAATAPTSVVAPTIPCVPTVSTNWGRYQQYCADGKPIDREKESAADRRAREQAESIGYTYGRRPVRRAA